jgi:glycosyltransferase involved in cell wall biosynthesis
VRFIQDRVGKSGADGAWPAACDALEVRSLDDIKIRMNSSGLKTYVVMPAYQAEATLPSVLGRIPRECRAQLARVLIVVDGCTDGTERVAREAAKNFGTEVELVVKPKNEGYARAQKTGFREALKQNADIVALLHSDGQYAPEELPRLLEPLWRREADVVQGSRMMGGALKGGMPMYKFIANVCLSKLENIAFGMNVTEYHSGYMLYSRRALETIPFEKLSDTFHFDGEMLLMAHKRKLVIKEMAIPTCYRHDVASHLKPIRYGFDVLKIIWRNAIGHYDF